jgi:hypothetical protein
LLSCSGPVWVKPTTAGDKVRVTSNAEAVRGCNLLGPVIGTGFYGPDDAIAILQNKTAEMGGDVVFVVVQPGRGTGARGEAYRCGSPSAAFHTDRVEVMFAPNIALQRTSSASPLPPLSFEALGDAEVPGS